jgi:Rhodopirellula transposase DDE domain
MEITEATVRRKYEVLGPVLNERTLRLWAAAEAESLGRGGIKCVSRATGLSRTTIAEGMQELQELQEKAPKSEANGRIRRPGGGRKPVEFHNPELPWALNALIDPVTRGDPESPLRWTCKSTRKLAEELTRQGHPVGDRTVAELLKGAGYSLQANRKTREGTEHPDRNAQFEYINQQVQEAHERGVPVISVDTKKKELVGDFKNGGREWQPQGTPEEVRVHDFIDQDLGKAIPYGVYDIALNQAFVNVGIDHDTPEFAVESVRQWWRKMGKHAYPTARELLITADCGGSNGARVRGWKLELAHLACELEMTIRVCHFPPGTSKWNKIEHRLFCHITENWRGRPLVSHEAVVNLIGSTTTRTGLHVKAALDTNDYPTGIKIPDTTIAAIPITPASFHGDWNYSIAPIRHNC